VEKEPFACQRWFICLLEKRAQASRDVHGEIIALNGPSFREQMMKRKRKRAERKDSIKSKIPEPTCWNQGKRRKMRRTESSSIQDLFWPERSLLVRICLKYHKRKKYDERSIYDGDRKALAEKKTVLRIYEGARLWSGLLEMSGAIVFQEKTALPDFMDFINKTVKQTGLQDLLSLKTNADGIDSSVKWVS
jgi:hypothetical protein